MFQSSSTHSTDIFGFAGIEVYRIDHTLVVEFRAGRSFPDVMPGASVISLPAIVAVVGNWGSAASSSGWNTARSSGRM